MFKVGQKVVCVDSIDNPHLRKDDIYTVIGLGEITAEITGVLLAETSHPGGCPFYVSRFRPVVERKTDISVLQALLVPGAKILETVQ